MNDFMENQLRSSRFPIYFYHMIWNLENFYVNVMYITMIRNQN